MTYVDHVRLSLDGAYGGVSTLMSWTDPDTSAKADHYVQHERYNPVEGCQWCADGATTATVAPSVGSDYPNVCGNDFSVGSQQETWEQLGGAA